MMAESAVRGLNHFDVVTVLPYFITDNGTSWKEAHPGAPFPPWLSTFPTHRSSSNNWIQPFIYTGPSGENEALFFSPHGIQPSDPSVQGMLHRAAPRVSLLAHLAPLSEDFMLGGIYQPVFGVDQALGVVREGKAKYLVRSSTFQERAGLMSYILSPRIRTLESGYEFEEQRDGERQAPVNYLDAGNGGVLVLV
jgi:hypothetical protein